MNPERHLPTIEPERIDPREAFTDEQRKRQNARHEREGSVSQLIRTWWRGDAHTHSMDSTRPGFGNAEGIYDLPEMAAYSEGLGNEFTVLTEHASNPADPEALTPDHPIAQSLERGAERITAFNKERTGKFAALSGVEASTMFDAEGNPILDVPRETLGKLDLVIASRHQIDREKDFDAIEASLRMAANHPDVDVLGHPDRHLMADNDWAFFCEQHAEARAYNDRMKALQQEKKESTDPVRQAEIEADLQRMYTTIKQVIGKQALSREERGTEEAKLWRGDFLDVEKRYFGMWAGVLTDMARNGKAFEINFGAEPRPELVRMAAAAGVNFFLDFDAHDFDRVKWQHTPDQKEAYKAKKRWANDVQEEGDAELLEEYKADRLQHGPGEISIRRLVRWIKRLENLGVTPDRVINSSQDRLLAFLMDERGKTTKNLEHLRSRPTES